MTFESQRQNNVKKSRRKSRRKDKGLGDIHLTLCLLVRPKRFELLTPWFVAKYSIQLSYGRVKFLYRYKSYAERNSGRFFCNPPSRHQLSLVFAKKRHSYRVPRLVTFFIIQIVDHKCQTKYARCRGKAYALNESKTQFVSISCCHSLRY